MRLLSRGTGSNLSTSAAPTSTTFNVRPSSDYSTRIGWPQCVSMGVTIQPVIECHRRTRISNVVRGWRCACPSPPDASTPGWMCKPAAGHRAGCDKRQGGQSFMDASMYTVCDHFGHRTRFGIDPRDVMRPRGQNPGTVDEPASPPLGNWESDLDSQCPRTCSLEM